MTRRRPPPFVDPTIKSLDEAVKTPIIRRVEAAQAVVDKYDGRKLEWGVVDCIRPVAMVLRELGHKAPLSKAGRYSSLKGAIKALENSGFGSLEGAMDAIGLPRIGYASALPGDIFALPGADSAWVALAVYLGNGRVLGFGDRDGVEVCGVMQPLDVVAVWRVEPWQRP